MLLLKEKDFWEAALVFPNRRAELGERRENLVMRYPIPVMGSVYWIVYSGKESGEEGGMKGRGAESESSRGGAERRQGKKTRSEYQIFINW